MYLYGQLFRLREITLPIKLSFRFRAKLRRSPKTWQPANACSARLGYNINNYSSHQSVKKRGGYSLQNFFPRGVENVLNIFAIAGLHADGTDLSQHQLQNHMRSVIIRHVFDREVADTYTRGLRS